MNFFPVFARVQIKARRVFAPRWTPPRIWQTYGKSFLENISCILTVGFLYGAGAETLIFLTGTSGKYPKLFVSRQKNQSQLWIPRKARKIGVWVSGAEIQTSAVRFGYPPLRNFPKSFWEKLRIFLESLGGSQRQLCIKTRPLYLHTREHRPPRSFPACIGFMRGGGGFIFWT